MPAAAPARRKKKTPQRPYHHGNLRAAMIEAAAEIVREGGAEQVTIREAARRAGVSSGAPFRHFADRQELMTAVAEDGMTKLRSAIESRLAVCVSQHPLARLMVIGDAYLQWAVRHPTHYRVLGDRVLIRFHSSEQLVRDNRWIRDQMIALFDAGRAQQLMRDGDAKLINLQSRALAYGLARMHVDAHLSEFGIEKTKALPAMRAVLKDYIVSLAHDPAAARRAIDAVA